SKGRTVADSIAERLTRPTAYKFKTDCNIIPVWYSNVFVIHRILITDKESFVSFRDESDLHRCEERDVVPPGVDDDLCDFRSVEAEFPAIVINDAFAPQDALQCKSQDLKKEISTNIGGEFTNLEFLKCWSLETSRRLFNTNYRS
ncbi:hypothetical protein Tco_0833866, partial [Tanacetum coccineum]